jgi:hypothetical protein
LERRAAHRRPGRGGAVCAVGDCGIGDGRVMRRVWAAVITVWATLAVVAALAWSHQPAASVLQATPVTILVPGKNGGKPHLVRVLVLPTGSAAHSATHSSQTAGGSAGSGTAFVANTSVASHVATGPS